MLAFPIFDGQDWHTYVAHPHESGWGVSKVQSDVLVNDADHPDAVVLDTFRSQGAAVDDARNRAALLFESYARRSVIGSRATDAVATAVKRRFDDARIDRWWTDDTTGELPAGVTASVFVVHRPTA